MTSIADPTDSPPPGRVDAPGSGSGPREWRLLTRLEKSPSIGRRAADGTVSVRRREIADCLLFGPFWRLPGGHYRLAVRCRAGAPRVAAQPVLGVEIIALNRSQQGWRELTADTLAGGEQTIDFAVPPALSLEAGEEARFEFRLFHLGNADLTIDAVDLRQIDESEFRPPPPRQQDLLGRLWASAAARRVEGGVRSAPWARPGNCLLYGGRPYVHLPEGQYRLSLRASVDPRRAAAGPVIGIEIVGLGGWYRSWPGYYRRTRETPARERVQQAWVDLTADELRAGPATVDFAVPFELSLDAGEGAWFEFKLYALGKAAVTIAGLDLRQLGETEIAPPVPLRWRLLGRLRKGAIGVCDADGVRVRGSEPAGVLLAGPRPAPTLAEGNYRLSIDGRAGLPRDPARPVLRAIVTRRQRRRGWRSLLGAAATAQAQHDFTAADVAGGAAALDLAVPAAPGGIGVGDDTWALRLIHLGNADLSITAVDLQAMPPVSETAPSAAGRPGAARRRRNIVIIGNCQAETVRDGFARAAPLRPLFNAKFHFVGLQTNLHEAGARDLAECDLLLVQDIRDWESYPLRDRIPDGVEIIKFPLLHFASLWPFDHYNGPGDSEAYQREWPNLTFLYQDGLLARLRKEIPDKEARFQAYRALEVDGVVNYVRLHDFERRRLLAMDREFGGEIGQFILDNFQSRQLFYTTNHPNRVLASLLMQRLMQRLDVDERFPYVGALDHLKRLQIPVHPKVARALGVKWADEATRYRYHDETVDWERYIRRYIDHYG